MFEFLDGGEDLERFEFFRMEEALSVLQQIVLSLSVSEQSLMFEHRDLHWGNVLIKRSKSQTLHYKLNGDDVHIDNSGVFVSIIDFTLSRLTKGKTENSKHSLICNNDRFDYVGWRWISEQICFATKRISAVDT